MKSRKWIAALTVVIMMLTTLLPGSVYAAGSADREVKKTEESEAVAKQDKKEVSSQIVVRSVILEHFSELAGEIINNVTEMTLEDINSATDGPLSKGLCTLLGGATGRALNEISEEIEATQEMIAELQKSVEVLAVQTEEQLDVIEDHLNEQDLYDALDTLNEADAAVDSLSEQYREIIHNLYDSEGNLKEEIGTGEIVLIDGFISHINQLKISALLDKIKADVDPGMGKTIYDVQLTCYKGETSFRHKTYMSAYALANWITQIRAGLLFFEREAESYNEMLIYKKNHPEDTKLEGFTPTFSNYESLYNQFVEDTNEEIEKTALFEEIGEIFSGVDDGALPRQEDYGSEEAFQDAVEAYLTDHTNDLQHAIDNSIVTEIEVYAPDGSRVKEKAYKVVSNKDDCAYYISLAEHTLDEYVYYEKKQTFTLGGRPWAINYWFDYGAGITTDGRYMLPESQEDVKGLFNSPAGETGQLGWLIRELRDAGGECLLDNGRKILLTTGSVKDVWEEGTDYPSEIITLFGSGQADVNYWQLQLLDVNNFKTDDFVPSEDYIQFHGHNYGTAAIYYGHEYRFSGDEYDSVVKDVPLLMVYKEGTYHGEEKPATAGDLPDKFNLTDQALDLSDLSGSLDKDISITGDVTIKGNGNTIDGLELYLCEGGSLTLENIHLTGDDVIVRSHGRNTKLIIKGDVKLESTDDVPAIKSYSDSEQFTITSANGVGTGDAVQDRLTVISEEKDTAAIEAKNSLNIVNLHIEVNSKNGSKAIMCGNNSKITDCWLHTTVSQAGNGEITMTSGEITGNTLYLTYGGIDGDVAKSDNDWTGNIRVKVELKTGDVKDASSDAVVHMTLYDSNGGSYTVDSVGEADGDQFERNHTDVLYYSVPSGMMNGCTAVKLAMEGDDGWYIDTAKVTESTIGNFETGEGQKIFYFYRWLDNDGSHKADLTDRAVKFTVGTADEDDAGTASKIEATVEYKDAAGNIKTLEKTELTNRTPDGKFSAGTILEIPLAFTKEEIDDIDEIMGFYVTTDHAGSKPGWKLKTLKFSYDEVSCAVNPNQWFIKSGQTGYFGSSWDRTGAVELVTKTADRDNAGTDSNIKLKLITENGTITDGLDFTDFCDRREYDPMERGATDTFHIAYSEPIGGEITGLILESDGSSSGPTWECDTIKVTLRGNDGTVKTYNFSIYCKIGKGSYQFMADKQIQASVGSENELVEILRDEAKDLNSFHVTADKSLNSLSAEFVKMLSETNKTMILEYMSGKAMAYQWIFRGFAMGEELSALNLNVRLFSDAIDRVFGIDKTESMVGVDLTDISKLPEGVSLNVNGSSYGFEPNDLVYIYSWNEKTKTLTLKGTVPVDRSGGILLDVKGGELYLLTGELAKVAAGSETAVDNGTGSEANLSEVAQSGEQGHVKQTANNSPKTGDDSNMAICIVLLALAAGVLGVFARKNNKKESGK